MPSRSTRTCCFLIYNNLEHLTLAKSRYKDNYINFYTLKFKVSLLSGYYFIKDYIGFKGNRVLRRSVQHAIGSSTTALFLQYQAIARSSAATLQRQILVTNQICSYRRPESGHISRSFTKLHLTVVVRSGHQREQC
jgi:hypothetical protein